MQDIIKLNINHLDYDLKERFDQVSITEKNDNTGFFFKVEASKTIDGKTYELVAEMRKSDFMSKIINWAYKTNPSDEKSPTINRTSNLNTMYIDMEDIIINQRFDKVYLDSVKDNLEMVSESKNEDEADADIISNINKLLVYHDAACFSGLKKEYSYRENVDIFIKTPYKIKFELKEQLKESKKIQLEQDILKLQYVDYIVFRTDNTVEISVTE